jgi:thioredoxin 1
MNGVKEIREADFQNEALASDVPVMVDFYAPWCGPCKMLAPALEGIAKAYEGRLKVIKVNVDEAQDLAVEYRVRGVPTLMFFKDGKAVETLVGLPAPAALRAKLESVAAKAERVGVCGCSA